MTKNKILLVFFALVFGFCVSSFADVYTDCDNNKSLCLAYLSSCTQEVRRISSSANNIVYESTLNGGVYGASIVVEAEQINYKAVNLNSYLGSVRSLVESVVCSSNDTCSVDLSSIVAFLQHINSVLGYIRSDVQLIRSQFGNYLSSIDDRLFWLFDYQQQTFHSVSNLTDVASYGFGNVSVAISNFMDVVSYDLINISNSISSATYILSGIDSTLSVFDTYLLDIWINTMDIAGNFYALIDVIGDISTTLNSWLPYLQIISDDLKYISTNANGTLNIDQNYTNQFYYSNLLSFDRFRYYAQGQLNNTQVSLYPLSPYDNLQNLRNATIYDAVAAGFESLLISQGSINNYLYWLKAVSGSNRLESVENHILAVSNLVGRLDNYVLNDFSNEIVKISNTLSYLTNRVDYTTNLVHLAELVETNNVFLSSIDSKLDVLDYIKILSDTPFADYSGDGDYFDYLTNLYINGSSSSGVASTNWFERMEILLASLVFGDSDSTNGVPQGVQMDGVDSSAVESALTDYSYSSDFTSGIDSLDQTKQNFFQILNSFHQSVKSVSCPASVSIGIGGLDGEDTRDFNDLMHGHFQVSFSVGSSDVFTTVVRSVTTICWVLVFLVIFWKAGFWLLRKMIYLYRVVNRLFWSVFTR